MDQINLKESFKYVEWNYVFGKYLLMDNEHYKLLAHLSSFFDKDAVFSDIGTFIGLSAVSLAYNGHKVYTFDVKDNLNSDFFTIKDHPTIEFILGDCVDHKDILMKSELIMLDIDHTGKEEEYILSKLREWGYRGIVVMDDIHLNLQMNNMFKRIPEPKVDITKVGHWSGTGIVFFDETKMEDILKSIEK